MPENIILLDMKTLACKDLGAPECNYVAKAETAEEAVKMMTDHAMGAHKDKMDEMAKTMTPEQTNAMMMSKVKDES
jgi:predicted small metal-binding protein